MVTPPQRAGRMLARRYHLQRVLGRGAMGAVWAAEDTVLRRPVAVKEVVLPPGLPPEERALARERTLREARAIARLGHANVVTLYDVLEEDSRPWVVMELVPSRSLADVVATDGPIHPLRAATVGLAILGALEAAHAAGITHRDVKPGNILLGHDGRVKLTDFGIARATGDPRITGTGLLVGSPSYLAPETVRGYEAGPPADMWGLGATLYAAVEGRAPFSGTDAMDTLSKVVHDLPAPCERAGRMMPALTALLAKDPARRATPVEARRLLLDVLRGGNDDFPESGPVGRPPVVEASALAAPTPLAPRTPADAEAGAAAGPAVPPVVGVAAALVAGEHAAGYGGIAVPPADARRAPNRDPAPDREPAGHTRAAGGGPAVDAGFITGRPATGEPAGGQPVTEAAQPAGGKPATEAAQPAGGKPVTEAAQPAGGKPVTEAAQPAADARPTVAELATGGAPSGVRPDAPGPPAPAPGHRDGGSPDPVTAQLRRAVGGPAADPNATKAFPRSPGADPAADPNATKALPRAPGTDPAAAPTPTPTAALPRAPGADPAADPTPTPTAALGAAAQDGPSTDRLARQPPAPGRPHPPPAVGPTATVPGMPAAVTAASRPDVGDPRAGASAEPAFPPTPPSPPLPGAATPDGPPDEEPTRLVGAGPLGFDGFSHDRRTDQRRRRTAAAMLAVAALVLIAVLGGLLAAKAFTGSRTAGSGTASGSSAATALAPGAVPAGFARYRHPSGFSVAVPEAWRPQVRPRGVVDVKDPQGPRFLRLIRAGSGGDPRALLAAAEPSFQKDHDRYRRVRLETVGYRGYRAADWEFTYSNDGETRHVLYRAFVADGSDYAIYLSATEQQWSASRRLFDVASATFDPS